MCIKYLNHSSNVSFQIFPRYCKVYTGCLGLAGRLIDFCVNASLLLEGHFLPSSYPLYNLFKESAMFKWFSQQFATVASYLASMCQPRDARWAAAWLSIVVSETGYRWPYCFIVLSFFFQVVLLSGELEASWLMTITVYPLRLWEELYSLTPSATTLAEAKPVGRESGAPCTLTGRNLRESFGNHVHSFG